MTGLPPVRPRRVMFSAILWTVLAAVSGARALVDPALLSIIICFAAIGASAWFWWTWWKVRQRKEGQLRVRKRR